MKIPGGRSDWSILEQDRIIGENESMKRRVKEMRNIIVVMAGALVLSLLGAAKGSFKDGANWNLVQFNLFLKDALLDERKYHRDTEKEKFRLAVEIIDLEEKLREAQLKIDSQTEDSLMDETIIRETTEYVDSLENRIRELELEIREAGVEFTPTDFEKLQEETAGDE